MCVCSWGRERVVRCGVTDRLTSLVVCAFWANGKWGDFLWVWFVKFERKRRAWRKRRKCKYKYVFGDVNKRRDVKGLTSSCGVKISSTWIAEKLYRNTGCCDTVARSAYFTEKEIPMNVTLLVALEGRSVKTYGTNDFLVFFDSFYLSTAGLEVWVIKHVFFSSWVELLCIVSVWTAQLRYYSL